MTFVELLKTWSTSDICEKLEGLNDLPTPLPPELEAQREMVQAEWTRRPMDERAKALAEVRAAH